MRLDPLLEKHRDEIVRIAAKHGAKNVRVFESFTGDPNAPKEGIDFLVDVGENTSPWFPGGLMSDLAALLDKEVFVSTTGGLHPLVRDHILNEAVLM